MKELQFQKLVSKAAEDWIPTKRGGEGNYSTLPIQELLVGDIIKLDAGMRIPTDCVLVESTDFATDESSLTGEPE